MKKSIIVLLVLAVAAWVGWQNRVNLLVWGIPLVADVKDPIAPNVPVNWPSGPETASKSPSSAPPISCSSWPMTWVSMISPFTTVVPPTAAL